MRARLSLPTLIVGLIVASIQTVVLGSMFLRDRFSGAALIFVSVVLTLHVGFNFYFRGVMHVVESVRIVAWRHMIPAAVLVLYPQGLPFALGITGRGENDLGCIAYLVVWWVLVGVATLLFLKTDLFAAAGFSFLAVFIVAIPTVIFVTALIAMLTP